MSELEFPVTRDEVHEIAVDAQAAIDELKKVINQHALLLDFHNYVLAKFVPEPMRKDAEAEFLKSHHVEPKQTNVN